MTKTNHPMAQRLVWVLVVSLLQATRTEAAQEAQVRAYVNDSCIVADEPYFVPASTVESDERARVLPLLGIVIGKLTELLVKYVIKATTDHITATAARKDTRYAVAKEMNLYRADLQPAPSVLLNAQLGCMTIVAAKFSSDSTSCATSYVPKTLTPELMKLPQSEWQTSRTDDSLENQLKRADICLDGKPDAVYEARFEFSEDGTAYRLRNAGYRVDSLMTSTAKDATRNVFYTLEISQPGKTDQHESISTAWVNVGTVAAGAHVTTPAGDAPPWLRAPALSIEARRAYEEQTRVHHEVAGEIAATRRSITRNQRILEELDQRIAAATSRALAAGLKQQRLKNEVQIQTLEAEVAARTAEYNELPQGPLEFMPVSIEIGVTETRTEKRALLALADVINKNSDRIASAGASASSSFVARSLNATSLQSPPDPGALLESTRASYFDALVDFKTGGAAAADSEARQKLDLSRSAYNAARHTLGLEPIQ
jgi:hypothetical protein